MKDEGAPIKPLEVGRGGVPGKHGLHHENRVEDCLEIPNDAELLPGKLMGWVHDQIPLGFLLPFFPPKGFSHPLPNVFQ